MSELCRCEWEKVFEMPVMEFLNLLCYRADKLDKQKKELEEWKRTH